MPNPAVKICGLSNPHSLHAAVVAGASHVGLVFFAKSPRNVDIDEANSLVSALDTSIARVGVVVDPDDALLARIAGIVDTVQLHGKEPPERAASIRQRFGLKVWKAVPVKTAADVAAGNAYAGAADFILYDAKTPDTADLPGGMGMRFDWRLLTGFTPPLPWGLSGGLDPLNVARAISITGAPLVDVSSGVESAPGVKDVDKIAAFCEAARRS